jgi:hypothetical protein
MIFKLCGYSKSSKYDMRLNLILEVRFFASLCELKSTASK